MPTHPVAKPSPHARPADSAEEDRGRERHGDTRDVDEVPKGIVRRRRLYGLGLLDDRDEHRASCRASTHPSATDDRAASPFEAACFGADSQCLAPRVALPYLGSTA